MLFYLHTIQELYTLLQCLKVSSSKFYYCLQTKSYFKLRSTLDNFRIALYPHVKLLTPVPTRTSTKSYFKLRSTLATFRRAHCHIASCSFLSNFRDWAPTRTTVIISILCPILNFAPHVSSSILPYIKLLIFLSNSRD